MGSAALSRVSEQGYSGAATNAKEYIRESIVDPKAFIVPGYGITSHPMPAYDFLAEDQILALVQMLLAQEYRVGPNSPKSLGEPGSLSFTRLDRKPITINPRKKQMSKKTVSVTGLALVLVLLVASVAGAQAGGTTIAGGFNAPQGVLVAPDGSVWVIDSGVGGEDDIPFVNPETGEEVTAKIGDSARVVVVASDGSQTVAASLPSILVGQEATGGARLALLDGTVYATSGIWLGVVSDEALPNNAAVVKIADGAATEVARIWELEKAQNPDPNILDSHPYGLTAGPDGSLYVADAGGNTLLKVDPSSGQADLVAVFGGLPGPFPNPVRGGAMETDPVPTAVAFDGNGNMYVSLLPGFPFLPGSAKVVKVTADGQVSDYATGLTMVTDLRSGPDG